MLHRYEIDAFKQQRLVTRQVTFTGIHRGHMRPTLQHDFNLTGKCGIIVTNRLFLLLAFLFFGSSAIAAPFQCSGTTQKIYVQADGRLFYRPSYRNEHLLACNVQAASAGIEPETCRSWFAAFDYFDYRQ